MLKRRSGPHLGVSEDGVVVEDAEEHNAQGKDLGPDRWAKARQCRLLLDSGLAPLLKSMESMHC